MSASRWYIIACVAAAALAAGPAAAQHVTVSGQVTDAENGQPIIGALVHVGDDEHEVVTDAEGRFSIRRVPPGERVVWATALGYGMAGSPVTVGESGALVTLALRRDPVRLAALNATVSRFESRRRAYARSVRVMTEREIAGSAASDMRDFVEYRAGLHRMPCGTVARGGAGGSDCVLVRGRVAMPQVYVDEVRWGPGLGVLSTYRPEEVARVEVYSGGEQVRIYTRWFLDWASRHNYQPWPLLIN
ncbi:MAG TPA: carboxypeptidase regulatory-like domain-containing protein [Longimicrobium sp.]|jgi:hypothetical protein